MFYERDLKPFLRVSFIASPLPAPPRVAGCYREKTFFTFLTWKQWSLGCTTFISPLGTLSDDLLGFHS